MSSRKPLGGERALRPKGLGSIMSDCKEPSALKALIWMAKQTPTTGTPKTSPKRKRRPLAEQKRTRALVNRTQREEAIRDTVNTKNILRRIGLVDSELKGIGSRLRRLDVDSHLLYAEGHLDRKEYKALYFDRQDAMEMARCRAEVLKLRLDGQFKMLDKVLANVKFVEVVGEIAHLNQDINPEDLSDDELVGIIMSRGEEPSDEGKPSRH